MTNKSLFQRGERAARLSSFVVAMISLVKGVVGIFSGSVALLAQAVESLIDVFGSLAVYFGLRIARKKPSEKFPYGYYRAETFASLVIALLILVSGIEILREAVIRFLRPEAISSPYFALSVAAFSIPFLYLLAKYNKETGEEINSQAIVGQAKNFTLDVYSSLLVFVGVLGSYLGIPWIDASIGALISIFILKAGASLGKDAVLTLMDAVWKPEHVSKMKSLAEEVPGVMGVHDIKIRKSGPFCFGEMHMEVEEGLSVEKAHALAEEVERKLKQECEQLEALIIHVEPAKKVEFRVAIPIEGDKGLESTVESHFGRAPRFILVDIDKGQIKTWTVKPNPGAQLEKKRGMTIADFLVKEKIDILLVNEMGEGPFHVFRDSSVELYRPSTDSNVREAITAFNDGKLEKLLFPKKES